MTSGFDEGTSGPGPTNDPSLTNDPVNGLTNNPTNNSTNGFSIDPTIKLINDATVSPAEITDSKPETTTDDGIIDQSSIDLSEDTDDTPSPKKEKNKNKNMLSIQSTEVIAKRIEALGNKLAQVEQPQITQSNSSSFTYRWFRPINSDSLIPNSTLTYYAQVFDKTRQEVVYEKKIDESTEEFIATKEFKKRQIFVTDLDSATSYYVKISTSINGAKNYQSATSKLEVFTEPNSIRNFKLFRPDDSPSTMLSARWAPPNFIPDLRGVQYELGIQGAPKKTYKWDLNAKTTMTSNFAWEGLTTGQKYFIRIRVAYLAKSGQRNERVPIFSNYEIRFICTEPLPTTNLSYTSVTPNSVTLRWQLADTKLSVPSFIVRGKRSRGRPKYYVIKVTSLGRTDGKTEENDDHDHEFENLNSKNNKKQTGNLKKGDKIQEKHEGCSDHMTHIPENEVRLLETMTNDFAGLGEWTLENLHPFCKYSVEIITGISCTAGLKIDDLVLSSQSSNQVEFSTLQGAPIRNQVKSLHENITLLVPDEENPDENFDKPLINYQFDPNFVTDNHGPIVAYAIEIMLADYVPPSYYDYRDGIGDFGDAFAPSENGETGDLESSELEAPTIDYPDFDESRYNPNCSAIRFPSSKDNCARWIVKWIPVAKVDRSKNVTVMIGDSQNSTIPKSLVENHNYLAGNSNLHDQHEHFENSDTHEHVHAELETISTTPRDVNIDPILFTKPVFENSELPQGEYVYIMVLGCTKVGCTRAQEGYWKPAESVEALLVQKINNQFKLSLGALIVVSVVAAFVFLFCCFCCCRCLRTKIKNSDKQRRDENGVVIPNDDPYDLDLKGGNKKDKVNLSPTSSIEDVNTGSRIPKKIVATNKPIPVGYFAEYFMQLAADSEFLLSEEFKELEHVGAEQSTYAAQRDANRQKNRYRVVLIKCRILGKPFSFRVENVISGDFWFKLDQVRWSFVILGQLRLFSPFLRHFDRTALYTNILPYDRTRVKIHISDSDPDMSYLNANHVPGFNSEREFIVTQGPLANTIEDFWWLIWEYDVRNIVMLCQTIERGRIKCEHYWPNSAESNQLHVVSKQGNFIVTLMDEQVTPHWTVRKITLKADKRIIAGSRNRKNNDSYIRELIHWHFTAWPDHEAADDPMELVRFVTDVRATVNSEPMLEAASRFTSGPIPIVVHCSAGCGRSGTFIAIDRMLQDLSVLEELDIYGTVCELRQSRCNMVQTEAQYSLLYQIVNKILQGEFTDLPTSLIENVILNIEKAAREEEIARQNSFDNQGGGGEEGGNEGGLDKDRARRKSSRNSRIDSSDSDELAIQIEGLMEDEVLAAGGVVGTARCD